MGLFFFNLRKSRTEWIAGGGKYADRGSEEEGPKRKGCSVKTSQKRWDLSKRFWFG